MAPVPTPAPIPGIGLQTGPLYLGWMLGSMLLGVLAVQCYIYYLNFPKDALWIKLYVVLIFLLELTFTLLTTIAGWRMVGSGWGDPYHLYYMENLQTGTPAMCALVTTLVHGFYCWRIYVLTGNKVKYVITGTIMSISLVQLIVVCVYVNGMRLAGGPTVDSVRGPFKLVATWLSAAALADVLIAATMVTILVQAKRTVSFSHTAERISFLIRLVIETGLITSIAAILENVLFLVYRDNNLHFIFYYMLAKLYANTFMATLNSRANLLPRNCPVPAGSFQTQTRSAFWADYSGTNEDASESRHLPTTSNGPARPPIKVRMQEEVIRFAHGTSDEDTLSRKNREDAGSTDDMELTPV